AQQPGTPRVGQAGHRVGRLRILPSWPPAPAANDAAGSSARGFVFTLSRQYENASREFEEAIRINPNLFDAYYYFARAAFANGHLELSADLFGRAARVR